MGCWGLPNDSHWCSPSVFCPQFGSLRPDPGMDGQQTFPAAATRAAAGGMSCDRTAAMADIASEELQMARFHYFRVVGIVWIL